MEKSSASALFAISLIFLVLAFMILSPDGRLICLTLAGLTSAPILILRVSWVKRILALMVLVIVVLQSISTYPEYKSRIDYYKKKALKTTEQKPLSFPK